MGSEDKISAKSALKLEARNRLVTGRAAGSGGGEAAHGIEGVFLDALQPAGLFGMGAVEIDAVADQLGHGNTFFQSVMLQPLPLFRMDLDLRSDHFTSMITLQLHHDVTSSASCPTQRHRG